MTLDSLLTGQPWAINPEVLQSFSDVLSAKRDGLDLEKVAANLPGGRDRGGRREDPGAGIAEIFISGSLSKRAFAFDCGTSYAKIQERIQDALEDRAVKAILLNIDSPGGTVPGVQELAGFIREADAQKPIYAWTDGSMTSAAYWLGSAARFVASNDTAALGSIGVYVVHEDRSEADAGRGVVRTIIQAGKFKALGNDAEPLSEAARAEIQERMDAIYEVFVSTVATHRGVSVEEAAAMAEGKVFLGAKALEVGLIDAVMTRAQVVEKISKEVSMKLEDLQANHPDLVQQIQDDAVAKAKADFDGQLTEAVQNEGGRVVDLAAVFLGDEKGAHLKSLVESGMTAEQANLAMGMAGGSDADQDKDPKPAKADEMLAAIKGAGADPVNAGGNGGGVSDDPVQAYEDLVKATMKDGDLSRGKAIAKVAGEHPEAHEAYLAAKRTKK